MTKLTPAALAEIAAVMSDYEAVPAVEAADYFKRHFPLTIFNMAEAIKNLLGHIAALEASQTPAAGDEGLREIYEQECVKRRLLPSDARSRAYEPIAAAMSRLRALSSEAAIPSPKVTPPAQEAK